jgi:hypothetical protein
MLAALINGHHFSTSALWSAASASAVCCSRGGISWPRSIKRRRTAGSASASMAAAAGLAEAETLLDQALRTACSQQARSLELRAATDLARLWMNQGKCAEALDVLASIHGRFTEGFDTRDLKEAKAVLVQ